MVTDRLAAALTARTGTVTAFDDHIGAGTVRDDEGLDWYVHCTRIADGSRRVEVGADVRFVVALGPTGLEAVDVSPR